MPPKARVGIARWWHGGIWSPVQPHGLRLPGQCAGAARIRIERTVSGSRYRCHAQPVCGSPRRLRLADALAPSCSGWRPHGRSGDSLPVISGLDFSQHQSVSARATRRPAARRPVRSPLRGRSTNRRQAGMLRCKFGCRMGRLPRSNRCRSAIAAKLRVICRVVHILIVVNLTLSPFGTSLKAPLDMPTQFAGSYLRENVFHSARLGMRSTSLLSGGCAIARRVLKFFATACCSGGGYPSENPRRASRSGTSPVS